ncbi:MAG: DUF5667 domain-containing protein [Methanoregula sp.]
MKNITGIFTGLLVLGLLCLSGIATAQQDASGTDTSGTVLTDDIQPYNGLIGADSPLYGLKLALEDIDESFTANETERVEKQMDHARIRLSEVRRALELNESDSSQLALNTYRNKMDLTNVTISRWGSNATGLLHAEEMIVKHQFVLEHLLENHPDNTGLQQAYTNSLRLEEKFGEKTLIRFNRTMEKNNKTLLQAISFERKEQDRHGGPDMNATINRTLPNGTPSAEHNGWPGMNNSGNQTVPTGTPPAGHPNGNDQQGGQQGQGQGHQQQGEEQGDSQQNGKSGDKGKSNSKNK